MSAGVDRLRQNERRFGSFRPRSSIDAQFFPKAAVSRSAENAGRATFTPQSMNDVIDHARPESTAVNHGAFDFPLARQRLRKRQWRVDREVVRQLQRWYAEETLFDFGAGIGLYCELLNCCGVDGIPGVSSLSKGRVDEGDLTDPNLPIPPHTVALCLEVAEHIPREFEQQLLTNLTRCCRTLIVSWATPDQPGVGHCNGRTAAEVISLLAERGFVLNRARTDELRGTAAISWLKRNLMVFERTTSLPGGPGANAAHAPCRSLPQSETSSPDCINHAH